VLWGLFAGVELAADASPDGCEALEPGRMVETRTSVEITGFVLAGQLVTSGAQLVMVTTSVKETTFPLAVPAEAVPLVERGEEPLLMGYGTLDCTEARAL
jgi:hypothetical protein